MTEYSQQQLIFFMGQALAEAKEAASLHEVPIGCVVVEAGKVIGRGHNLRESSHDPTAHAEIFALSQASQLKHEWRLQDATLFVTLEPCPMCAGAIVNSRIKAVYYGCADLKAGCAGTLMNLLTEPRFNHQVKVDKGLCKTECKQILNEFFSKIREKQEKD